MFNKVAGYLRSTLSWPGLGFRGSGRSLGFWGPCHHTCECIHNAACAGPPKAPHLAAATRAVPETGALGC